MLSFASSPTRGCRAAEQAACVAREPLAVPAGPFSEFRTPSLTYDYTGWGRADWAGGDEHELWRMESRVLHPPLDGSGATVAIRLMAGAMFLWNRFRSPSTRTRGGTVHQARIRSRRRPNPSWATWRS